MTDPAPRASQPEGLRPCPCCAGESRLRITPRMALGFQGRAECMACGLSMQLVSAFDNECRTNLTLAWNRRAPPPAGNLRAAAEAVIAEYLCIRRAALVKIVGDDGDMFAMERATAEHIEATLSPHLAAAGEGDLDAVWNCGVNIHVEDDDDGRVTFVVERAWFDGSAHQNESVGGSTISEALSKAVAKWLPRRAEGGAT